MASFEPRDPATLEEQRRYLRDGLVDVACDACAARVGVRKNSEQHTSIQWTLQSVALCKVFAARDQTPGRRDVHRSCPNMMASVDAAVRDGDVSVGAVDGY
ncbi:MAG: hypothetical protein FWE71_14715 [Nocardioidaceae bacterium]|nr:hypothetical protein [Nocardioidaceae bacterium]MCL2614809.1 hypothetical protein [Nocardioidaceae bacterium]